MYEYLSKWLANAGKGPQDPEAFLARLAQFYAADAAGLTGPFPAKCQADLSWWKSGRPAAGVVFPWQKVGKLDATAPAAQTCQIDDQAWLWSSVGTEAEPQAVIWVVVSPARQFRAEEIGFLPLAGCGLWRSLDDTSLFVRAFGQAQV